MLLEERLKETGYLKKICNHQSIPMSENPQHFHTWISKNPRLSIWISMIFGCQSSIIHARVDIHIDIQAGISMKGHSTMDIRKQ